MKADHNKVKRQISIVKGQLEGILKMIDDDCYCIDISNQILASIAILKKVNNTVVAAHLRSCVLNATEENKDEKLKEMEEIMKRMAD